MFHKIELEQDENGKSYIKRIVFDIGDVLESFDRSPVGYNGKTFEQLMENGEIRIYSGDEPFRAAEAIEFKKPISIDRFLIMFREVFDNLEKIVESDDILKEMVDPEKYIL